MSKDFTTTTATTPDDVRIVSLAGYLDAHTASRLEDTIQALVSAGQYRIVVDFEHLEYISSAGLGVFMVFIEGVRAEGGDLKLAAMKPKVYSVFDLLGFPVLFDIHDTVDAASASFRTSGHE